MIVRLTTLYLWLDFCHYTLAAATFNCYVCSYTLSGDPSLDYECVTQPWNVTKGLPSISCTAPYQCVTKALLSQDKTQIRSVSRSCLPQQEDCSGEKCCSKYGVYSACEHKCREDMCNNRNAEEWLHRGGSSGASGVYSFTGATLSMLMTCFMAALM